MSYFGTTPARVNMRCLRLENCWEIGNQGVLNIAHGLPNLVTLSLSGCSKINDDAIEVIAEQLRHLTSLNLSWCSRISDASLEYIACDLADSLRELIIDRFVSSLTYFCLSFERRVFVDDLLFLPGSAPYFVLQVCSCDGHWIGLRGDDVSSLQSFPSLVSSSPRLWDPDTLFHEVLEKHRAVR